MHKKATEVAKAASLNELKPISPVITSLGEFADRLLVEAERGCMWKCGFCMMGSCKKPVRFLDKEILLELIDKGFRLGLVASNITDYPWLDEVVHRSVERGIWLSVSSIRLDKLDEKLLFYLRQHQRSLTLAPEAATFKIRQLLGKPFTDSQIERALLLGRKCGFSEIKLYFIYGLEEEDESDLIAIGQLVSAVHKMGYTSVRLSFNAFVPKIGTKLGSRRMQELKILREKIRLIKSFLPKGCQANFESVRQLRLQYEINQAQEWAWERFLEELCNSSRLDEESFLGSSFSLIEQGNN